MSKARQKAIKAADAAFSLYIRRRDGFICFTCGHTGREADGVMQCGHLITRSKYSVRWDEDNAFCQCRGCNMKHEYFPEIFTSRYIHICGIEMYESLVLKSNTPRKYTIGEIRDIAAEYKAAAAELEMDGGLYA
jgi:hypothetical protein